MKTPKDLLELIESVPAKNFIVDDVGKTWTCTKPETHVGCILGQCDVRKWTLSEIRSIPMPSSPFCRTDRRLAQINNGGIGVRDDEYQTRLPGTSTSGVAIKRRLLRFVRGLLKEAA